MSLFTLQNFIAVAGSPYHRVTAPIALFQSEAINRLPVAIVSQRWKKTAPDAILPVNSAVGNVLTRTIVTECIQKIDSEQALPGNGSWQMLLSHPFEGITSKQMLCPNSPERIAVKHLL